MGAHGWTFVETRHKYCTEEELADLRERRALAKANPFRKGMRVSLTPRSLHPESIYSHKLASTGSRASELRRPVSAALLETLTTGGDDRVCEAKLVKGIQKGPNKRAQVWQATLEADGVEHRVLIKFYVKVLLPLPRDVFHDFFPRAEHRIDTEAQGFAAFRSVQGIDVPMRYGFYNFEAPWGEQVVGVILEDLSEVAIPLPAFAKEYLESFTQRNYDSDDDQRSHISFTSDDSGLARDAETPEEAQLKASELKTFILTLFEQHRRLQDLGHTVPIVTADHVYVVKPTSLDCPQFVFASFDGSMSQEAAEREHDELQSQEELSIGWPRDHRYDGEHGLHCSLGDVFGRETIREWYKFRLFQWGHA
ncbi:hypothetical protein JCM11491_002162 [Sporobolomyces phaffii]